MTQEALRLALEMRDKAIAAIQEALEQSDQNFAATIAVREHAPVGKVAYVLEVNLPVGIHKLYTTPQRTWVGLDEVEIIGCTCECIYKSKFNIDCAIDFARAIEAKLKEKNT